MSRAPNSVVAFVARQHGLAALEALLDCPRYRVEAVVTHRRLPLSEDPGRSERPDFHLFSALAEKRSVPLLTVDGRAEAVVLDSLLTPGKVDLLASVSWRRIIPPHHIGAARFGGVNLHRGALPRFAGAFPIRRALEAGEREVVVTAHILAEAVDAGEVLLESRHPASILPGESLHAAESRLKDEITPVFGPLLLGALDALVQRHASLG